MRKNYFPHLLGIALLFTVESSFAQQKLSDLDYGTVIKDYLAQNSAKYSLTSNDVEDLVVSSNTTTNKSGLEVAYINQAYNGIKIYNAISTFAVKNGEVFHHADNFESNLVSKVNATVPALSAQEALLSLANKYGVRLSMSDLKDIKREGNRYELVNNAVADGKIIAELVYHKTDEGKLQLAWHTELYSLDASHLHDARVDALSGDILDYNDMVLHCNFGEGGHSYTENVSKLERSQVSENTANFSLFKSRVLPAEEKSKYNVLAIPVESPLHGEQSIVESPADPIASPEGWHDNGTSTITKGNNVNAYEDRNNRNRPGNQPDGGSELVFDYEFDIKQDPRGFQDAVITNLFYMSNVVHDVYFQYGLDEASGNFQQKNFTSDGRGGDLMRTEAQDGSGTNNANFSGQADGSPGRVQMYLFTMGGGTDRDGSMDNTIVTHEYGHGISLRLAGGGNTMGCLGGSEQMGEGWSDWFGLALTIERGDKPEDRRGAGVYALGQGKDGKGIRSYPYSTDKSINPFTYKDIRNQAVPHGVGSVWATILWDLTWKYIEKYGYDPDVYNGKGGNNRAMQVIMDGLKLQKCNPGFVDGRDAILKAEQAFTGGEDQCLIWEVFANRGVGYKAKQGTSRSNTDQTEDFSTPPDDDPTLENCTDLTVSEFKASDYKLFPNPTQNELTIRVQKSVGEAQANLVDINGRVVLSKAVNLSVDSDTNIDMSSLASGVYILTLKGESINTFDKVIKN